MLEFSDYIISEKKLSQLLTDGEERNEFYNKLIERKFYVGEADVARKNLNHWEKEDLLPYDYNETGWRKFSLVEFTWLRVITELRNLGLSLEKIKKIKTQLFNADIKEFQPFFLKALEGFSGELENKKEVIKFFKRKDIPEEQWKAVFEEAQISDFTILILQILIFNNNLCLIIEGDETNCHFVVLGDYSDEKKQANKNKLNQLLNKSFVLINVRKIIHDFFTNEKINNDNDYLISFLNKKEKALIDKIQLGNLKEIKIRFKNNTIDVIELTKTTNNDDVINKISRLLKKGEYKNITLKARDGKLIAYEETDFIKN